MTLTTKITDHLFRQQSGKMNSILLNYFGFGYADLIDDVIQETFLAALKNWGMKGVPDNPEGWLMQVAKNKVINELNRQKRHAKLNGQFIESSDLSVLSETATDQVIKSEQLKALFSCCSPLLSPKSQIMLTLKIVCGFGDREIAKGLLMNQQSVRKAMYRARNTLNESGRSEIRVVESDFKSRIDVVLTVLYLMFNEGYHTSSGDKILDEDISYEAIKLTSWLLDIPNLDTGKIHALLALMFFSFSRFDARMNPKNEIIDIEHQDRTMWKFPLIEKGIQHQRKSRESLDLSKYHIESGIAAAHCLSPSFEETNWQQIISYYKKLLLFDNSHIVQINYAIALSEAGESYRSLEYLNGLDENHIQEKALFFAAKARVYSNIKNNVMAKSCYQAALDLTVNANERKYYKSKLSSLF